MNESTLVPREEMSDLDWLARNVHVWPYELQTHCYVMTGKGGKKEFSASAYSPFSSKFTKSQWLASRAELQNKPSWKDAPEWANWLCQRDDGMWFWCIDEPRVSEGEWETRHEARAAYPSGDQIPEHVLGDWRDTLEKRPDASEMPSHSNQPKPSTDIPECEEVKQFEPFVSVEDAATAKQSAPKGSGNPILGMVLADLTNRALEGKEKYGEPLLAHNGRNPLWDAYQEALDLAMYLRQAIEEQK